MNVGCKYKNKYFSILGDSLSTLAGYNPPEYSVFYDGDVKYISGVYTAAETWWGIVIDSLGGELLMNGSYSGTTVAKHPECEIESYGSSSSRTSSLGSSDHAPDVIMVFIGLNDYGRGMPIYPTENNDGIGVFSVAYRTMLAKIKANYPESEVWCLTLPCGISNSLEKPLMPPRRSGGDLADYSAAIRECANDFDCRVIDICNPDEPYATIDGYHPTSDGMRTIAKAVLRCVDEFSDK